MSNILIGLKKTCLGVLDRADCDKNNETGLKEGGRIEMSTTVLHSRCTLFRLNTYLRFVAMFASVATFNSSAVLLSISIFASSAICWSATALVFAKRDAFLLCLAS